MEQVEIKVQWVRKPCSGRPPERWVAHLESPWRSMDFAWLQRRQGAWQLIVCPDGIRVTHIASYDTGRPELAMKHLVRWIVAGERWRRLIIAGSDDPRERHLRLPGQPSCETYARRIASHPLLSGDTGARRRGW